MTGIILDLYQVQILNNPMSTQKGLDTLRTRPDQPDYLINAFGII